MEITTKKHRYDTIYKWKSRGVIYPDYDELYQTYINTLECQHCLKEFKSTRDRCMDHDHQTGQFRMIVCQKCNVMDTYIKYPNGYTEEIKKENYKKYKQDNKEKIQQQQKQKHNCECGGKYTNNHKSHHIKSKKHQEYLDNNN